MSYQVSTQGDVYSFGMLLFELLTGKKPTDDMFHDGMVLRSFVEMAFPDRVLEIVDPQLFLVEEANGGRRLNQSSARELLHQCLLSMITVGLWCSRETPTERPLMQTVVTELQAVRAAYVGGATS